MISGTFTGILQKNSKQHRKESIMANNTAAPSDNETKVQDSASAVSPDGNS